MGLRKALQDFSANKKLSEAEQKIKTNPQVKSIRLSAVLATSTIVSKMAKETDLATLAKLNGALTLVSIAMSILNDDFSRASRLLSRAKNLASVRDEDIKEG